MVIVLKTLKPDTLDPELRVDDTLTLQKTQKNTIYSFTCEWFQDGWGSQTFKNKGQKIKNQLQMDKYPHI